MPPSIFRYYFTIFMLIIPFLQTPCRGSSFSFKGFGKDSILESDLALLGDAKVAEVNGSWAAQLTELKRFSAGSLVYRKPFKLLEGSPAKLVSFSTYFSFSISNESGMGLSFLISPNLSVFEELDESLFKASQVWNKSEFNALAIGLDTVKGRRDAGILAFARIYNVSSDTLGLNSGDKLSCWIDYEASSKLLEVRLRRYSDQQPMKPLLMYSIDITQNKKGGKEVYIGFSSANRIWTQSCFIYSWNFTQRFAPNWMHSQPMNPSAQTGSSTEVPKKCSHCAIRVLAALIFGVTCGVLGAYMIMLMWRISANRRHVTPEKLVADPSQFKVVDVRNKGIKDGLK